MNLVNFDDVLAQLRGAGLVLDKDLRFDAKIQRWKVDGEDAERRGWSRLREWTSQAGHSYIVGAYGVWHGNDDGYTKIELPKKDAPNRPAPTKEDEAAIREAQKESARKLDAIRKAEAKTAAGWAAQVWAKCAPATEHDYLTRKRIGPNGTRVLTSTDDLVFPGIDESNIWRLKQAVGALVVPMHDSHGNVCGIQFVYPAGHPRRTKTDKEFWPSGMAMGGTFGMIGHSRRDGVLLVAEGFATAASLFEATGLPIAYAFAANNLLKAGKEIRRTRAAVKLLFCADDDYLSTGNPGVKAASDACAALEQAEWIKPDFTDPETGVDRRDGKKLTDFNDLAVLTGIPLTLATQINARLDELKWRDGSAASAGAARQGGGDSGGRRKAKSVMSIDDLVARFVPLDDGTGDYVFDTWTNKVAKKAQMIALLPAGVRGDDIKRHPVWVERGAYFLDQVGFDPAGNDPDCLLNTWRGWPIQAKAGKCQAILDTLWHLCSGEGDEKAAEIFKWLLCWMAYPLQNPGAKMSSAVIMHGPQGTGKSLVFQTLAKIYGEYSTVLNQRGLEDKFNSDWSDSKLFILAEEVVTRAEMWHIKNELKELVTGEWIRINPKNIAAYRQRNRVNICYLSNENQPLPIDNDDRRHLVVYTPPPLAESHYDAAFIEAENGGIEALYHYLLEIDLAGFHPKKRPPMTEAKRDLMALSSPSEIRFATAWVMGDLPYPVMPCRSDDLYAAYLKWCKQNGEVRFRASNVFLGAVSRLTGWHKRKASVYLTETATQTSQRPMIFPPAEAVARDGNEQAPGTPDARYLTDCARKFSDALRGSETGGAWAA